MNRNYLDAEERKKRARYADGIQRHVGKGFDKSEGLGRLHAKSVESTGQGVFNAE